MQDIASTIEKFMRMAKPTQSDRARSSEQVTIINADVVHLGTANNKACSGMDIAGHRRISINEMTCEQERLTIAYLRRWRRNFRSTRNIVDYVDGLNRQQLQFLKDYVNSL